SGRTSCTTSSAPPAAPSSASRSAARAVTTTSSTRSPRPTTTRSPPSSPECGTGSAHAGLPATTSTLRRLLRSRVYGSTAVRYGNDFSWISNERGKGWVQLEFPDPQTIDRLVWRRDLSEGPKTFTDPLATSNRIEVSLDGQRWRLVADSSDRIQIEKRFQEL